MNQTLAFLLASIQRAENEGARSLDVSIKDLRELMPFVEAGMHTAKIERPMKHLGWMRPGSVAALCSGSKRFTRVSRKKDAEFNVEVFYADCIRDKQRESDEVMARLASEPVNS